MNNRLYYVPTSGTILVTGFKFIIKDTKSGYWYRVYKSGRVEKLKSMWDHKYLTRLIYEKTLIPISETEAMATFTVAAKPIIPNDWEFAEESPRCPNVGDYFVKTKDNQIVRCDTAYSTPIGRDNRRYIVKKKEAVMIKHIPFSGPGQYKLVNGQIVNLNENRLCRSDDGIKSATGNVSGWKWSPSGEISGLGFYNDNSLYLAEKISSAHVAKETPVLGIEDSKYFVAEKSTVSRFDYWVAQPAKNFANVGRHVLFAAAVSSIIYGAVNPVKIVSVVKSCLPKINIEWKQ